MGKEGLGRLVLGELGVLWVLGLGFRGTTLGVRAAGGFGVRLEPWALSRVLAYTGEGLRFRV